MSGRDEAAVYQAGWEDGYARALADLLAKVLTLPPVSVGITDEFGKVLASTSVPGSISRTDVLALFGSSDDLG